MKNETSLRKYRAIAMDSCITNFYETFPKSQNILGDIPKACINFKKVSSCAKGLIKNLDEDTCRLVLSYIEENVPGGLLHPIEISKTKNPSIVKKSLHKGDFVIKRKARSAHRKEGFLFGFYSNKNPNVYYNGFLGFLINTFIKRGDKTFFALPCPVSVLTTPFQEIVTGIECDHVYLYCENINDIVLEKDDYGMKIFPPRVYNNLFGRDHGVEIDGYRGPMDPNKAKEFRDLQKKWGEKKKEKTKLPPPKPSSYMENGGVLQMRYIFGSI